jgi:enamine deaminase RidA (YjgF/YER057c/UK114 family)
MPLRVANDRAYVSGHGPLGEQGRPELTGQFGGNLSDEQAADATRTTVLNLLASLRDALGDLERVAGISQMRCFVVALPDQASVHPVVAKTAAQIFGEVFPGRPIVRATTIGVDSCALGLPVTIDLVVDVKAQLA